jgi:hypothetical protein
VGLGVHAASSLMSGLSLAKRPALSYGPTKPGALASASADLPHRSSREQRRRLT